MASSLQTWFDRNLGAPRRPDENHCVEGELVYGDSTSCGASFAESCVYRLANGTYRVVHDLGQARGMGGPMDTKRVDVDCPDLRHVVDALVDCCFHDPNTTGNMAQYQTIYGEVATRLVGGNKFLHFAEIDLRVLEVLPLPLA